MKKIILTLFLLGPLASFAENPIEIITEVPVQPTKPVESKEWAKILTPEQYASLRQGSGGEPFDAIWKQFSKQEAGTYYCAGCNTELLSSEHKFDTKLGRPAFFRFIEPRKIHIIPIYYRGYKENTIRCATCEGYLGYLYTDEGYDVLGGKHYSLFGPSLKFLPKK